MRYRLVGVPASFSTVDDILIQDEHGDLYLLNRRTTCPERVADLDVPMVFTFYEPVERTRWTDLGELSVMRVRLAPATPSSLDAVEMLDHWMVDS